MLLRPKKTTLSLASTTFLSCDSSINAWARYSRHIGLAISWKVWSGFDVQQASHS